MPVHGKDTRVLVNEIAASSKLRAVTIANSRALGEVPCFGDDGEKFIPGLRSGTLTLEGPFEDNTLYSEVRTANGVDNGLLVSAAPAGFALGKPVATAIGDLSSHEITSQVSDAIGWSIEASADELVDFGVSLHDLTAETATGNGTSVDNAASSANGGVAVLHVTAYSGLTNVVLKVQHSVDNSAWVDLATFTTVTAATSERVAVTGTVNRYLRLIWTVTGSGEATFAGAFARR